MIKRRKFSKTLSPLGKAFNAVQRISPSMMLRILKKIKDPKKYVEKK
jgi:hypothetical protein